MLLHRGHTRHRKWGNLLTAIQGCFRTCCMFNLLSGSVFSKPLISVLAKKSVEITISCHEWIESWWPVVLMLSHHNDVKLIQIDINNSIIIIHLSYSITNTRWFIITKTWYKSCVYLLIGSLRSCCFCCCTTYLLQLLVPIQLQGIHTVHVWSLFSYQVR